ncbi:AEC family transporter [Paractinoplanes ferrugineus]|uniref:Membrane protein n=1 Tax=Paractinoplanes ferrugineus TaxID=113564 RepID=A0A919MKP0_9ACTN|nr:AEC family transporter [Actinoplanes ferrugineus]GIE15975.1 membrane protein [Actinoplanes ferrugineus]
MLHALDGFALIGAIVLAGWAVGRFAGLPETTEEIVGRLVYTILAPCLLFTVVARADPDVLFSEPLLVSGLAALLTFIAYGLIFFRRDRRTRIMGGMCAGYVNANYIGIPIATYVLNDAALVVPIMMLQLLVITPIVLALLTSGSAREAVLSALRNPLVVAVALGATVAATGLRIPAVVADPLNVIGQATVPLVLIAFGLSLHGRAILAPGPDRAPTLVAVAGKTAGMPAIAFLLALLFRLPHHETYAVTVLAGLPTAQNVFLHAQRFRTGLILARDAVFLSTIACVPVLLLIAVLFTR